MNTICINYLTIYGHVGGTMSMRVIFALVCPLPSLQQIYDETDLQADYWTVSDMISTNNEINKIAPGIPYTDQHDDDRGKKGKSRREVCHSLLYTNTSLEGNVLVILMSLSK